MIKLIRSSMPPTLAGIGKRAAANLKRARTRGALKFVFSSAIYGCDDVRTALRTMHKSKCAFCESKLPQLTAGHVEHYRPKGEVQQDVGEPLLSPGYYWLAYEWSNLLLACEWCNTRAKRKLFPLQDSSKRVRTHKEKLVAETPLLLNPADEDPQLHLEFVDEEIKPRNASQIGAKSIQIYRLDDPGLTEERRRKLRLFEALRTLAKRTDPKPEVQLALAEVKTWERRIKDGDIEYAGMLRANL